MCFAVLSKSEVDKCDNINAVYVTPVIYILHRVFFAAAIFVISN
jgi:hypothetical protein